MRPRVFPAEDERLLAEIDAGNVASMRPRVFPAEDVKFLDDMTSAAQSFNEAAGIPRGRHTNATDSPWPAPLLQ